MWAGLCALVLSVALTLTSGPAVAVGPWEGQTEGAAAAAPDVVTPGTDAFRDVPVGSTYYAPVTWMVQNGLTTGRSGGTLFGVRDNINRAEAATFLYRLVDPNFTPPASSGFPDVTDRGNWDYAPITWLVDEGVVSGYADGTFRPLRHITRGELAKVLYGVADPAYSSPGSDAFSDVRVGSTYHLHISWLKSIGATHGYSDGTYRPDRHINRGEAAQLIQAVAGAMGFDTTVAPESFTIGGRGFGHGVGMSQYGAREMASQGYTAGQVLRHYYAGVTVSDSSSRASQNLRVHVLSTDSTSLKATTLDGGTARVRVRTAGDIISTTGAVHLAEDGGQVVTTLPDGTRSRASAVILEWRGTRFWEPTSGHASTLRVPDGDGGSRPLDLRHGKLVVTVVDGRLNLATELRMNDEYLYGLAEMPSSWPATALQVQAIAGRSYALRQMGSLKPECGCHVWDEVRSQKFTGWAKESEGDNAVWGRRWVDAVDATVTTNAAGTPVRALSLWYGGRVIEAFYSSSSAGRTRNATEMGWNATPYLVSRSDPYSTTSANPNRTWTASVTQERMAEAFSLPNVMTVRETAQNATSGYTDWMTATSSDGTSRRIAGNDFRTRLGLRSAYITSVTAR